MIPNPDCSGDEIPSPSGNFQVGATESQQFLIGQLTLVPLGKPADPAEQQFEFPAANFNAELQ